MSDVVLRLEQVSVYRDGQPIVQDVTKDFYKGECIGIIGANGNGKTTLLKAIRQLLPYEGHIYGNGQDLAKQSDTFIAKTMSYMQQQVEIPYAFSAEEIVMTGRYAYQSWWDSESDEDRRIVQEVMAYTGVSHLKDQRLEQVSGGEKQRILLAKSLAQETDIMLLDEPTSALDKGHSDDMFRFFQHLCKQGKTIITVVHDLELAAKYCTRLLLIGEHRVIADGTPEEVLRPDYIKRAFDMDTDVFRDERYGQLRIEIIPTKGRWQGD